MSALPVFVSLLLLATTQAQFDFSCDPDCEFASQPIMNKIELVSRARFQNGV